MTLQEQNKQRWNNCHIPANKGPAFQKVADRITANKAVYAEVEKATGVPWWFVGIVHYRESNLDMRTNIAQGDPWNKKSIHVPKNRGPFKSFQEAAVDALTKCAPYAAKNKDWSVGGALTMFEKYNGLGYAGKGKPSPYVWAGTDQYVSGKYVADGKYDANAVDTQLGCAGIMKFMGLYKTDVATGPVAGTAAGLGFWATASQFIHTHPYLVVTAGVIIAGIVWGIVHGARNKNA